MLIFQCDVCGLTETAKRNTFKLDRRTDICRDCLKYLDMAADLMDKPGFKEQLAAIYRKFYPSSKEI